MEARQSAPGATRPGPQPSPRPASPLLDDSLRRYRTTLLVVLVYATLLLLPWVVTCTLNHRGSLLFDAPYTSNLGAIIDSDLAGIQKWRVAISVLNGLTAVLAVPVALYVVPHAATAFVQRSHKRKTMNARTLFSLADMPWIHTHRGKPALWEVLFLLFFALILATPPVLSGLVDMERIRVLLCRDIPYIDRNSRCYSELYTSYDTDSHGITGFDLALDAEPYAMNQMYSSDISNALSSKLMGDLEDNGSFFPEYQNPNKSFAAVVSPNNATTGLLRYHALRMNSTVSCDPLSRDQFSAACPGDSALIGNFTTAEGDYAKWCVPRSKDLPWPNIRDRVDITEEVVVDWSLALNSTVYALANYYLVRRVGPNSALNSNFTMRCVATTSRGYFELPSEHNNNTYGPLLTTWPTINDLASNFNDRDARGNILSDDSTGRYYGSVDASKTNYGPLWSFMFSSIGDYSWLDSFATVLKSNSNSSDAIDIHDALRSRCRTGIPLSSYNPEESSIGFSGSDLLCSYLSFAPRTIQATETDYMNAVALNWFYGFSNATSAVSSISKAVNRGNQVLLNLSGKRWIYSAPGFEIIKPRVTTAALATISALIGLQLAIYLVLLVYIYQAPTFGRRLTSTAIATMGAQLAAKGVELPPLRSSSKEERAKALAKLDNIDGLIGVDEPLDESVNAAVPPAPTVAGVAALRGSSEQRRVSLSSRNSPPPYQRQAHPGEETYELRDIDISEDPVGSAPSYFPSNPRTSALPALAVGGLGLLPRRTPKKPISKPIAETPV